VAEDFGDHGAELVPGDHVAGYQIEAQIGRGGMAVVYRALDLRLGRPVALKVLAPHLSTDEAFRQRFIRESQAAAGVDHPHIIPVFEAGQAGDVLFIAMRYVAFGDVRALIEAEGPLAANRTASMATQVASALDAAHAYGLIHRDVKPGNILIDRTATSDADHVYLSDFGLSKHSLAATTLTATGQFMGTLDYVSPEQIQGHPADGRADQYALACTVMEMLTGAPPFRRDESMALLWDQLEALPPPVTRRRPDLPAAIDVVIGTALAKSPANRYPTCMDFAVALRQACDVSRVTIRPATAPPAAVPIQAGAAAGAGPGALATPIPLATPAPPTSADAQWPATAMREPAATMYDRPAQRPGGHDTAVPRPTREPATGSLGDAEPRHPSARDTRPLRDDHLVPARRPGPPPRRAGPPPRRSRATVAVAAVAVVAALSAAGYVLTHHSAPRPHHGSAATRTTGPQVTLTPAQVVQAYINAINAEDYRKAWALVGDKGPSYQAYEAGFAGTARDTLTIKNVAGNVVTANLAAAQTNGSTKYYQGTYTVTDGIISKADVEQIGG
jgi:Protein kinase domain